MYCEIIFKVYHLLNKGLISVAQTPVMVLLFMEQNGQTKESLVAELLTILRLPVPDQFYLKFNLTIMLCTGVEWISKCRPLEIVVFNSMLLVSDTGLFQIRWRYRQSAYMHVILTYFAIWKVYKWTNKHHQFLILLIVSLQSEISRINPIYLK